MSYKAEMNDGSGFASNALRFPTRGGAIAHADELKMRWLAVQSYRIVASEDPPTEGSPTVDASEAYAADPANARYLEEPRPMQDPPYRTVIVEQ